MPDYFESEDLKNIRAMTIDQLLDDLILSVNRLSLLVDESNKVDLNLIIHLALKISEKESKS